MCANHCAMLPPMLWGSLPFVVQMLQIDSAMIGSQVFGCWRPARLPGILSASLAWKERGKRAYTTCNGSVATVSP